MRGKLYLIKCCDTKASFAMADPNDINNALQMMKDEPFSATTDNFKTNNGHGCFDLIINGVKLGTWRVERE
jgi:hypothetical protein